MAKLADFSEKYMNIKTLAIAAFLIAICKIVISLVFDIKPALVEDYKIAVNLVSGLGYCLYPAAGATAIKAPAYPLFLSAIFAIFGVKSIASVAIAQHIIGAFYPIITFKMARKIMSQKAAFIAAALWLVHPSYQYYSFAIEATNLFIISALVWLYYYVCALTDTTAFNTKRAALLGLLSGLCYLVQPISAIPVAAALIYLIVKTGYTRGAVLIASGLLMISPWTIRNYMEFGKFIPGKSPMYMNLYVGYLELSHGKPEFSLIDSATNARIDTLKQYVNDVKMESVYADIIMPIIKSNPALYTKKAIWQAGIYWSVPPRYFNDYSVSFILARRAPMILLNLAFIISAIILYKSNKKLFIAYVLIMAYFTMIYALTATPNIRFKLDSEWLIFLAIGLSYDFIRGRLGSKEIGN